MRNATNSFPIWRSNHAHLEFLCGHEYGFKLNDYYEFALMRKLCSAHFTSSAVDCREEEAGTHKPSHRLPGICVTSNVARVRQHFLNAFEANAHSNCALYLLCANYKIRTNVLAASHTAEQWVWHRRIEPSVQNAVYRPERLWFASATRVRIVQ